MVSERAGKYIKHPDGYRTYIPKPLPPSPPIEYDDEIIRLLSDTDIKLARLDGVASVLPDIDIFISMYLKKEAVLSSQIEGTQISLEDYLEYDVDINKKNKDEEIEVLNYIKALHYGLNNIENDSISIEDIKGLHRILVKGTRGEDRNPGEFREGQGFIRGDGLSILHATYIAPPPEKVDALMKRLAEFINKENDIPHLVRIALIHHQFETIHPFSDGNGRLGRMLITFYLLLKQVLFHPILFLSLYLRRNRGDYYEWLMKVRLDGEWEGWVKYFLKGVSNVSDEVVKTCREIIRLREELLELLYNKSISSIYTIRFLDFLFESPVISIKKASESLNTTRQTIYDLVNKFLELGILNEITGKKRYKRYKFVDYIEIINRGTEV
jgi:Fic family protein